MKSLLVTAIAYFEKSSQESLYSPARFCYPFYRSYLAITFQEAKDDEVQKYLAEAREAVGRSESKDKLLKAVENLAKALQEAQSLKTKSVQEIIDQLDNCRLYCEKAAENMTAAEDKAPGAVKLMRKGNPLLEDRIKATVAEIQEKARLICEKLGSTGEGARNFCRKLTKEATVLSEDDYDLVRNALSNVDDLISQRFPDKIPAHQKPINASPAITSRYVELKEGLDHVLNRLTVIEQNVNRLPAIEQDINNIKKDMNEPVKTKLTFKVPFGFGEYGVEINDPWIKRLALILILSIFLIYLLDPSLIPNISKAAISKLGFNMTVPFWQ